MLIALIPARSGSKRVPHKNIRELAGHPLLAYTIQVAKDSGLFGKNIYVCTDHQRYIDTAINYGAQYILRQPARDTEPDSEWIKTAYDWLDIEEKGQDLAFILRPTSPFRRVKNIIDCYHAIGNAPVLKSVKHTTERPEKMWHMVYSVLSGCPLMCTPYQPGGYHYNQSSTFDPLFVQSGGIEVRNIFRNMPINGPIVAHLTEGYEGFDINTEDDWILAEALIERGLAKLPEIK